VEETLFLGLTGLVAGPTASAAPLARQLTLAI
jgi:hypothetical protein